MDRSKRKKICKKCARKLSINNFNRDRFNKDGLRIYCKRCLQQYRLKNRAKISAQQKIYAKRTWKERKSRCLQRAFGITYDDYKKILISQQHRCAICQKPGSKEKTMLSVDHNHQTGHIRGLLCNFCNSRLLRYLRDNKRYAIGMINYLSKALDDDKYWK